MPNAQRQVLGENRHSGRIRFTSTEVELGDDGVKGLRHLAPISQGDWVIEQAVPLDHNLTFPFDPTTSRLPARQESLVVPNPAPTTSKIRKRIVLPNDFGSFPALALGVMTRRSAAAPTSYKMSLFRNGVVDPAVDGVSILGATATPTWHLFEFTPALSTYLAQDFLTLEIEMVSSSSGQHGEAGDLAMAYITRRGNI